MIETISQFFMKELCAHVACEYVCANFLYNFLIFQNVTKMHLKIKGTNAPKNRNIIPVLLSLQN
jgi:hypothetical protein